MRSCLKFLESFRVPVTLAKAIRYRSLVYINGELEIPAEVLGRLQEKHLLNSVYVAAFARVLEDDGLSKISDPEICKAVKEIVEILGGPEEVLARLACGDEYMNVKDLKHCLEARKILHVAGRMNEILKDKDLKGVLMSQPPSMVASVWLSFLHMVPPTGVEPQHLLVQFITDAVDKANMDAVAQLLPLVVWEKVPQDLCRQLFQKLGEAVGEEHKEQPLVMKLKNELKVMIDARSKVVDSLDQEKRELLEQINEIKKRNVRADQIIKEKA